MIMNTKAVSVSSLISAFLLSDHRVLQLAWDTPFRQPFKWSTLREPCYLAYQSWAARVPDHVFDSAWSLLETKQTFSRHVVLTALQTVAEEFLERQHESPQLRRGLLGTWLQGMTSRISSLPIHAIADVNLDIGRYSQSDYLKLQTTSANNISTPWQRHIVPLFKPEEAVVADYIEREGLHETHMHLNGSTHAEICWLRAISNPKKETHDFAKSWHGGKNSSRIRELVKQCNPSLTPQILDQHLLTANRLRTWLIAAAEDKISSDAQFPISCYDLCKSEDDEWSQYLMTPTHSWKYTPDIEEEITWMVNLIRKLQKVPSEQLSNMFHCYLLLLNEYYRLLVQSESQYGFDQFQKFTLTELREPVEQDYLARFHALHGIRDKTSKTGYLEGRFAPKNTTKKSYKLFKSVLSGYLSYLRNVSGAKNNETKPPRALSALLAELEDFFEHPKILHRNIHRLALVAHFIKQPWSLSEKGESEPFRHYQLTLELQKTTNTLLYMLGKWPRLQTWVRGIDAAANELHAPPDVFSSAFRICKRAGITRRTFHAGEDFRHILSGICTMWETLILLDLSNGDRIGHGTAMGIAPKLWLERMPSMIILPRGEWMLSMLASWQLLRNVPEMESSSHKLQRELEMIANEIFGLSVSAPDIERAMALRWLNRIDLQQYNSSSEHELLHESLNDLWREEAKEVKLAYENQNQAVKLLWIWLSDKKTLIRAEEFISKPASFLDVNSYVRLQQELMRKVAERSVLIETLPSSNVRISQYDHISEHHSLRWMRVPGYIEEGDPEIMACLGSDDPGIFASDLETEFYLLYGTLLRSGLNDSDALKKLQVLNERGRIYRFHHHSLS